MDDLEERIRNLARDGRSWVHHGVVTAIASHDAWGFLLDVTLQPDGREVQARPAFLFVAASQGAYVPFTVGDEVLVLFPDGDANNAIAIAGLTGGNDKPPGDWNNDRFQVTHPTASKFETADNAVTVAVVTEPLLPDLSTSLTEISTLLSGLGLAPATTTGTFIPKLGTDYRSKAIETE